MKIVERRTSPRTGDAIWMKFECGAGSRWTSTTEDSSGDVCGFSGCNCGTLVKLMGETDDRREEWFGLRVGEKQRRIAEYEAKRAEKAQRFEQCAENAERRAAVAFDRADLREEKSGIPLGQPILVGHHSERRHRRALERADNAMRKGIEESDKAKYYARRAENATSNDAIMSDDPAADDKLIAKIQKAEQLQQIMKDCNAAIRKHAKAGPAAQIAALVALGRSETHAQELIKPDFCGRIGFADYQLTNNGANIRRMKERLQQVTQAQAAPEVKIEGTNADFEDCPQDNRVRLFFPGKPSEEVRTRLKRNGFRWSPTIGAWQAYRHNSTIEFAKIEAGIVQRTIWNSDGTDGPCLICAPPINSPSDQS